MFQIRYDSYDAMSGFFATKELAEEVLAKMLKNGMDDMNAYVEEVSVFTDYTSWCKARFGFDTLEQFCEYRDR